MFRITTELCKDIKRDCIEKYNKKAQCVTLKDIKKILECRITGDYSSIYELDLYKNKSGLYCALLCSIENIIA